MGNYRNKLDIIADILAVADRKPKKTQIMYRANLNFRVLEKYLKEMSKASLICFENETECYALTSKGKDFLDAYLRYSRTHKRAEKIIDEVNLRKKTLEKLFS